jgi:hypothetical protein
MAYTVNVNRVHPGYAANTSGNTVFTFSPSIAAGGAVLRAVTLVNQNTGTTALATGYLVANGASAAANNEIFRVSVPANDTVIVRGPWYENSNAFVVVKSDTATVNARVSANELS